MMENVITTDRYQLINDWYRDWTFHKNLSKEDYQLVWDLVDSGLWYIYTNQQRNQLNQIREEWMEWRKNN